MRENTYVLFHLEGNTMYICLHIVFPRYHLVKVLLEIKIKMHIIDNFKIVQNTWR